MARQGAEEEQDEEQDDGVDKSRHGGAAAVVDVRHGAGDGAGDGDAAKEGHDDVGRALSHQLRVRVVPIARHAVGHGGREERLDGAKHGDGKGRGQEQVDRLWIDGDARGRGQGGIDLEAVADGFEACQAEMFAQDVSCDSHHYDGCQRSGYALRDAWREHDDGDAGHADGYGWPRKGAEAAGVDDPFREEVARHVVDRQPEQVFDLGGEDG